MSIPEPEFRIDVYQLMRMLEEQQMNEVDKEDRIKYIHRLRSVCFDYLDTI